jgi:signal recognition particle receptor subunit alpha
MLDSFSIQSVGHARILLGRPSANLLPLRRTQGGLVLWSRSFTPSPSPFDSLVREALIEQRASSSLSSASSSDAVSRWDKDAHALLWLLANDFDLIFCCAYQRILSLPYVPDLLVAVRKAFLKAYSGTIKALVESSSRGKDVLSILANEGTFGLFGEKSWDKVWEGWAETFNRILREFESEAAKVRFPYFFLPPPFFRC